MAPNKLTNPHMGPQMGLLLRLNKCALFFVVAVALVMKLSPIVQVSFCFFIDDRQSPGQHEWNYAQQHEWPQANHECAGNAQSPINIQHRNVIVNNHLRLHFYNYNQFIKFTMQNAHHTIKMNPIESSLPLEELANSASAHSSRNSKSLSAPPNSLEPSSEHNLSSSVSQPDPMTEPPADDDLETEFETHTREPKTFGRGSQQGGRPSKGSLAAGHPHDGNQLNSAAHDDGGSNELPPYGGAPAIKLDWLDDGNNEYKLRDIHFHWGERRDNGSEHAIEGKRAAMEMHLVHIKHGLEKSKIGYTSDSVAVIAVLVESYRKSNADFNPIVNALGRINLTDQAQEIEYKAIRDLLPSSTTNFYTYSGSLTTPPCYQVVNWIVMQDRLYLNAKQIEMFRNLYAPQTQSETEHSAQAEGPSLIMPNIRQTQPLSNRTILASFSPYGRLEQIQIANTPMNGATSSMMPAVDKLLTLLMALGASIRLTRRTKQVHWG